jgi:hypothetical protein
MHGLVPHTRFGCDAITFMACTLAVFPALNCVNCVVPHGMMSFGRSYHLYKRRKHTSGMSLSLSDTVSRCVFLPSYYFPMQNPDDQPVWCQVQQHLQHQNDPDTVAQ